MPGKQNAPVSKSSSAGSQGRRNPPSAPAPRSGARTGERDENYALISVLYHALQGAETVDQYIEDARRADDDELVSFFEETKASYVERSREAKLLLASRLEEEDSEEEEEEQEEEEEEEEE